MDKLQRFASSVLVFLYPQRCLGCEDIIAAEELFCQICEQAISPLVAPLCERCGVPFATGPDRICGRCLAHPPAFARARAWAYYESAAHTVQPLSAAIQRFKYRRNMSTGKFLAQLCATHFGATYAPLAPSAYDLILPVPLHPDRLRWRGFNQSLLLAQAIGKRYQIKVDPLLLVRTRSTLPQTQMTESERKSNVRGAFCIITPKKRQNNHKSVKRKRVLVVDDVYTSGATVEECARVLYKSGASEVGVFTLARAVFR